MVAMLLTVLRALHYGAMVSLVGTLLFELCVASPTLRRLDDGRTLGFWRWCRRLTLASAVLGILSGLVWLFFEASAMSGKSMALVVEQGIVPVVLSRTRFGHDWLIRGILAMPLIACLVARWRWAASSKVLAGTALTLAAAELVAIAGAGHAAAGTGWAGTLQLLADGVHLLAAGAWIGGLLPFAWLFATVRRAGGPLAADIAYDSATRFSRIGLLAVATLVMTGSVNSIFLVGSVPALLGTDYGHLLLVKLALFLTMVVFAAINRQWLVPQLARSGASSLGAQRNLVAQIERNALIEAGLGLLVLVLVGALGTTPPALHAAAMAVAVPGKSGHTGGRPGGTRRSSRRRRLRVRGHRSFPLRSEARASAYAAGSPRPLPRACRRLVARSLHDCSGLSNDVLSFERAFLGIVDRAWQRDLCRTLRPLPWCFRQGRWPARGWHAGATCGSHGGAHFRA
ncbi:MAG TPA: copper homeostasis membrane protein CopD [Stellaceae bacterium]|nr:copper homeostasis membrane protein CopD [Stellaceae bacterium]